MIETPKDTDQKTALTQNKLTPGSGRRIVRKHRGEKLSFSRSAVPMNVCPSDLCWNMGHCWFHAIFIQCKAYCGLLWSWLEKSCGLFSFCCVCESSRRSRQSLLLLEANKFWVTITFLQKETQHRSSMKGKNHSRKLCRMVWTLSFCWYTRMNTGKVMFWKLCSLWLFPLTRCLSQIKIISWSELSSLLFLSGWSKECPCVWEESLEALEIATSGKIVIVTGFGFLRWQQDKAQSFFFVWWHNQLKRVIWKTFHFPVVHRYQTDEENNSLGYNWVGHLLTTETDDSAACTLWAEPEPSRESCPWKYTSQNCDILFCLMFGNNQRRAWHPGTRTTQDSQSSDVWSACSVVTMRPTE